MTFGMIKDYTAALASSYCAELIRDETPALSKMVVFFMNSNSFTSKWLVPTPPILIGGVSYKFYESSIKLYAAWKKEFLMLS